MSFALLLLFQAGTQTRQLPPIADLPPKTEEPLRNWRLELPKKGCADNDPAEIVVCGSREDDSRYRLPPLSQRFESEALKAETQLMDGVTGGVNLESHTLPNGMISKRVMVTVKAKF